MQRDQVVEFLKALGAEQITPRGQWVSCSCPLAPWTHDSGKDSRPSFAINCTPATSWFNCYTCRHGDLSYLLMSLKYYGAAPPKYNLKRAFELLEAEQSGDLILNIKDEGEEDEDNAILPYSEAWLSTFIPFHQSQYARDYLRSRGVPDVVSAFLDVRYDSSRHAVCFPIRDFNQVLVGLRARYIDPKDERRYHIYKTGIGDDAKYNKLPWFGESWVDFDKPVLMVESVFDVASVYRVYRNVVGPMSVGMNADKVKRMGKAIEIVTLFDWGVGGAKARALINKHLGDSRFIYHIELAKEFKDPGAMTVEQLHSVLAPYLSLDPTIQ